MSNDNKELEQQVEMTEEELKAVLGELMGDEQPNEKMLFVTEPLMFDETEIETLTKSKEFLDGVNIGNKLVGIYTSLVNGGIDIATANDIIILEHTNDTNIKLQKVMNEAVKLQASAIKNSQL